MDASVLAVPARRNWLITLISAGHFHSHFCALCLPPLFPVLRPELGASYTQLGGLLAAYSIATAIGQIPMGVLVDRIGGRFVLVTGLIVQGMAFAAMGFSGGYWEVLALVALAGLGNSVFHPADYAILSARIEERHVGRAVSIHTFVGYVGWGLAPPVMLALITLADWRTALVLVGCVGLGLGLLFATQGPTLGGRIAARTGSETEGRMSPYALMRSQPMVLLLLFFFFSTSAAVGLQAFVSVAVIALYGVDLATGGSALTAYLLASAAGVLLGGVLADRYGRHRAAIICGCLAMAASCGLIALGGLPILAVIAILVGTGVFYGLTSPARDLLVRACAPKEWTGLAFGFTSSGISLGSAVGPLILGRIMDAGAPSAAFIAVAVIMLFAIPAVLPLAGDREGSVGGRPS